MKQLSIALLVVFTFLLAQPGFGDIDDPVSIKSKYTQAYVASVAPRVKSRPETGEIAKLQGFLAQTDLSEEDIYLARIRLMLEYAGVRYREVAKLCRTTQVRDDDFITRSLCIRSSDEPLAEQRVKMEALLDESLSAAPHTNIPTTIGTDLIYIFRMQNDIIAARFLYEKILRIAPKEARYSRLNLKLAIALMYVVPSNSPSTIEEGLRLLDDLEKEYSADPDSRLDTELMIYNKAIIRLMAFDDYEFTLRELARVSPELNFWIDSKVFRALALARLGRKAEARSTLNTVDFSDYPDPSRLPFLKCYRSMVQYELKDTQDLSSCWTLPFDTQPDVVFHITKELSRMSLAKDAEIAVWRQFWNFYQNKLAPQMRSLTDDQVNAMELQRARTESEMKSLELKNFQLMKILFAITIIALVINLGLFFRLRRNNHKIMRLQTYIQKSVLARFLPPVIVEEIIQGRSRIESAPREESITVLFSDMVGFTSLSGRMGTATIAQLLNRFMQSMTDVIHRHEGTIDKFIGDSVMVIFGAPLPLPEATQAAKAIACAKDMIRAMEELNIEFKRDFGIEIDMRIGINQGAAIVGTFGSEKRSDYTAIGPTVNLASRIESKASPHEILLGPDVARHVPDDRKVEKGLFQLKGIAHEVRLYTLK